MKPATVEGTMTEFLARNVQTIISAVVVVFVGAGIFLAYGYFAKAQETKAQEELFSIEKIVEDKAKALEKDATDKQTVDTAATAKADKKNKKTAAAKLDKPVIEKTPESLEKNFSEPLKQYDQFIQAHQGKKAAYIAAIHAATLSSDYKDFGRAESFLKKVAAGPAPDDLFWGLVKGQLTGILIEEKKCNEAIPELVKISENKAQSFFQPHALLRLGACYIEAKDYDRAQAAFLRIEKDFPHTQAEFEAKDLKKLVLLRRGQKS
jgi:predicted negative regulator of RcsB-dependent stress response